MKSKHICLVCDRPFNRLQRLLDHYIRVQACGVSTDPVRWMQENGHTNTILKLHELYFSQTSRQIHSNKYREVRRILKATHSAEEARLALIKAQEGLIQVETIAKLNARISELEAENKTLREAHNNHGCVVVDAP